VCVFLQSHHEQAFMLCYVEENQVRLKENFLSFEAYTNDARNGIAGRIFEKNWGPPDDRISISALLEISAKRLFVDLTDTKSEEDIVCAMDNGISKFFEL
jgi:hypothetical protein